MLTEDLYKMEQFQSYLKSSTYSLLLHAPVSFIPFPSQEKLRKSLYLGFATKKKENSLNLSP